LGQAKAAVKRDITSNLRDLTVSLHFLLWITQQSKRRSQLGRSGGACPLRSNTGHVNAQQQNAALLPIGDIL